LGVGVEQPQRVVARRARRGLGAGVAETLVERELAVTGERDLAAGIFAFGDVAADQRDQPVDLAAAEAERFEIGRRQRKFCGDLGADGRVHGEFLLWTSYYGSVMCR